MSQWNENDEPALTFAAIRWYAMSLEKLAADLYITDRSRYPAVKAVLAQALNQLEALRPQQPPQRAATLAGAAVAASDGGGPCPPGFEFCGGLCLPSCPGGGQY